MAVQYNRLRLLLPLLSLAVIAAQQELQAVRNRDVLDPTSSVSAGSYSLRRASEEDQDHHSYAEAAQWSRMHTARGPDPRDADEERHHAEEQHTDEEEEEQLEHRPRLHHDLADAEHFQHPEAIGRHIPAQHLPGADPTHDPAAMQEQHHHNRLQQEFGPASNAEGSASHLTHWVRPEVAAEGSSTSSRYAASSLMTTPPAPAPTNSGQRVEAVAAGDARGPGLEAKQGDPAAAAAASTGTAAAASAASDSTAAAAAVLPQQPGDSVVALTGNAAAATTQVQSADLAAVKGTAGQGATATEHSQSNGGAADSTARAGTLEAAGGTNAGSREQQPQQGPSAAAYSTQTAQPLGAQQLPAQGSSGEEHRLQAGLPQLTAEHQAGQQGSVQVTAPQQATSQPVDQQQQQEKHQEVPQETRQEGQALEQQQHQPEPLQMLVQHIEEPQMVGGDMPDDSQAAAAQAAAHKTGSAEEEEGHGAEGENPAAVEQEKQQEHHEEHLNAEDEAAQSSSGGSSGLPQREEPDEAALEQQRHELELEHHMAEHGEQQADGSKQGAKGEEASEEPDEIHLMRQQHEEQLGHQQEEQEEDQPQPQKPGPQPEEPKAEPSEHEEAHDNYHLDQRADASQPQAVVAAQSGAAAVTLIAGVASVAVATPVNEPSLLEDAAGTLGAAGVTPPGKGSAVQPAATAVTSSSAESLELSLGSGPPQGSTRIVLKSLLAFFFLMVAVAVMLSLVQSSRRSFGGRKVGWEDPAQDAGIMGTAISVIRELQSSFGRSRHPALPITNSAHTPLLDYCVSNGIKEKRDSSSDGGDRDARWGRQSHADVESGSGNQRGSYVAMRPARNVSKTATD